MNLIRRVTKCLALTLRDGENFDFEKLNSLRERILFFIWGRSYGTGNRGDQKELTFIPYFCLQEKQLLLSPTIKNNVQNYIIVLKEAQFN